MTCLRSLFEEMGDGHVAFAIGKLLEEAGDCDTLRESLLWYREAQDRYPLPKYQEDARRASSRVAGELARRCADAPPREVLVIVGCTKAKIWDQNPSAPRFVAARDAYVGRSLPDWVSAGRDEPSGARWLFLSAKYGFLEPDHPIANYDVTFTEPSTGPLSAESLRAQAVHQTRWGDKRLSDFSDVRVLAGPSYGRLVRQAFEGIAAGGGPDEGPGPPPSLRVDEDRCRALGAAIAALPPSVFDAIDQGEPEWVVLERLRALPGETAVLTALALGLTDYRLGEGGADAYWRAATEELNAEEPRRTEALAPFIDRLLAHPVSERDADRKRARIRRLLTSGVPGWLNGQSPTELVGKLPELWQRLAAAMRQEPSAKTVVFAIKLVDLMCFQASGRRAELRDAPIAVDIRVARASLASGVVTPAPTGAVDDLLRLSSERLLATHEPFLLAWNRVASFTDRSPLALDSLVWQAGAYIGPGARTENSTASIGRMLVGYGATTDAAQRVATELVAALDR